MFVEALQHILTTDAGMVSLLGTSVTRPDSTNGVFPVQAPDQPSMPYMVISQVSGEPTAGETMQGTGPLTSERWRFSCYGTTYKNAKSFAKYSRRLLLTLFGQQTAGKVRVESTACVMEADDSESLYKGTLFSTHIDFAFVYYDQDV